MFTEKSPTSKQRVGERGSFAMYLGYKVFGLFGVIAGPFIFIFVKTAKETELIS
jgi:hypothetical protein